MDETAAFIVIDNNPTGTHANFASLLANAVSASRYIPAGDWTGAGSRDMLCEDASRPVFVCLG